LWQCAAEHFRGDFSAETLTENVLLKHYQYQGLSTRQKSASVELVVAENDLELELRTSRFLAAMRIKAFDNLSEILALSNMLVSPLNCFRMHAV
jgi:hypothetical protein